MAAEPLVLRSREGSVEWLTLNRPAKRNALDEGLIAALKAALRDVDADDGIRVAALRGAGPEFCAGADLASLERLRDASVAAHLADVDSLAELFLLLRRLRKPVVAVVHGRALAGGCGLATACDLVVAAASARFGYPEVRIGFVPAMVLAILRRKVSESRAFELVAMGEIIGAAEAERIGLVNRVFPDASFSDDAAAYVQTLATRSASALQLSKRLLYHQDGLNFEAALRAGADLNVIARLTDDTRAGVDAFLRKEEGARADRDEG